MSVQRYLTILRERWVAALSMVVLVLAAVGGVTALQPPTYEASANVFVRTDPGSSVADRSAAADYARQQISTYADLVTSPIVLDPAIDSLGLTTDAGELAKRVSATVPEDTLLISITAQAGDARSSAELANAVAASLRSQVAELETASGPATVQLTVVTPATAPSSPASPNLVQNFVLGLLAALLAGLLAAVLRDLLDNRVRKTSDVEALTDAAVIGTVARMTAGDDHTLVSQYGTEDDQSESYRELRSNLRFLELGETSRSLLVTSSVKGEGKSVTSINLAAALARAGCNVLLVDADLRDPSLHSYLGLEGGAGLSTVLIGDSDLDNVVQPVELPNLTVLASGRVPPNPAELLDSDQMTAFLDEAAARYDVVILDSAPLLAATDAAALARRVSGTIFVAGSGTVRRTQMSQALRKLQLVDRRLLGVVLNGMPKTDSTTYSQIYRDAYAAQAPQTEETAAPRRRLRRGARASEQRADVSAVEPDVRAAVDELTESLPGRSRSRRSASHGLWAAGDD
ncbi:polysaccharide biosynthesis tyrosine autokinase [Brevibacterium limosum]|uniref:polysaccharide biosynthesis tyrosine autokinase n=1 Tax=Brevibacterium limosum TaxID=2697565 RepID=UPI001421F233|nr:polysaccharide biosynthesis tyrosine autokinase [Brevibacterium limosum]